MDRIVQILSQMLRIESEKGALEPASPLRKELISNLLRVSNFEGLSRAQITQIVKVCKDYLDHALEFRRKRLTIRRVRLSSQPAVLHQRLQRCSFASTTAFVFHDDQHSGSVLDGHEQRRTRENKKTCELLDA